MPPRIATRNERLGAALAIGLMTAGLSLLKSLQSPEYASDLDQLHYAARVLLAHANPYDAIGPGLNGPNWHWPLYYPLPAVLVVVPLAMFPVVVARAIFTAFSSAALAWALAGGAYWRRAVFVSGAWFYAILGGQWAPLLYAAMLIPWLGWAFAGKPTIGIAAISGMSSKRAAKVAVIGALAITAVSFLVMPTWPSAWWRATQGATHITPLVTSPLGLPLLLAGMRWRRPEARLLLVLALVPQNPAPYETVLLFAIPKNSLEAGYLAIASWAVSIWVPDAHAFPSFLEFTHVMRASLLVTMYLPALLMVLRRRNEGELPKWAESATRWLPHWIRGVAA